MMYWYNSVMNEGNIIINIGWTETFTFIGILIAGSWYANGRFTKIEGNIENIQGAFKEMVPDLKQVREKFFALEERVNSSWKDSLTPANSPRQLNKRGSDVLKTSGIIHIVDNNLEKLTKIIKDKNIDNPYDAEIAIGEVMAELPKHCPELIKDLKEGAFNSGVSVASVLFVGSIYLRNLIFEKELGFKLDQLDKENNGE